MLHQRDQVAEVDRLLDAPLAEVLISMPGIGVRTTARTLLEVGDGTAFVIRATWPPTPGRPRSPAARAAASAANAHSRRQQQLRHAFLLTAFAALTDPVNRARCNRERTPAQMP
ncbi:hypothetical protein J2S44_001731 [Catenuloplanes niger]|uniref:Transposase n=1 Tax=Catenuloplanes niger TaxID=587534 RepID=A0AAE3ZLC9_9ACTN|nr:hypothetical protein [Catenuloplanes niger]